MFHPPRISRHLPAVARYKPGCSQLHRIDLVGGLKDQRGQLAGLKRARQQSMSGE
jgi:hypothetical protein